jgi:hypothetical protein
MHTDACNGLSRRLDTKSPPDLATPVSPAMIMRAMPKVRARRGARGPRN